MDNIDIASLLANFVIAGVIMYLTDRERKTLLERLSATEKRLEELNQRYVDDLRDWSGIDPKFKTWRGREEPLDSDTKIRAYMLTEEERQQAIERMNK
jgi:O-methyltransferase involved in polyketide biosynthesis